MSIVITGVGAVTPVGIGREATWEALTQGKSGIETISLYDPEQYDILVKIAGEVRGWDPKSHIPWVDKRDLNYQHRSAQFADFAIREAKEQAKLLRKPKTKEAYDTVNLVGTGAAGSDQYQDMVRAVDTGVLEDLRPYKLLQVITNMLPASVSKTAEQDLSLCFNTACATSGDSMWLGATLILNTVNIVRTKVAFTGGAEAPIWPANVAAFDKLRALSRRNDEPQKASRPFDKDRDGFVMAEGAVVTVTELESFAKERDVTPLARLVGWGSVSRSGHPVKPSLRDMVESMRRALTQARLTPGDIDLIVAHATSTGLNDLTETDAIKETFGEKAYSVPITAPKSMVGHLMGAAGGVGILVAIKSIQTGLIPPILNYEHPDPKCNLDYVSFARKHKVRLVMVNAFGFGNQNSCLIFEVFEGWKV